MRDQYYASQRAETASTLLEVVGSLPEWLEGTLIRNGPALFEAGQSELKHWFDGYGMLHAFTLRSGRVEYHSRFIDSNEYRSTKSTGRNKFITWGSAPDPCRSIFRRLSAAFLAPDNTNVAVAHVGKKYFTTSDIGVMNEFDPATLDTLSTRVLGSRAVTAAHPSYQRDGSVWNMRSHFGPVAKNTIFSLDRDQALQEHVSFPTLRSYYFHSFANTDSYFISIEQPMYLSFWKLLGAGIKGRSYYECFSWDATATNTLHLYNRSTKQRTSVKTGERFFFFHIVNTFEEDGWLHIDFCAYDDNRIVDDFYLDVLRTTGIQDKHKATLRRLSIHLATEETALATTDLNIELPTINTKRGGQAYRFAYGIHSSETSSQLSDSLVKYDFEHKTHTLWQAEGVYPGEPIFVSEPRGSAEDAGVILSVCYEAETGRSYLLVLDAQTMREKARAYTPARIPAGLHGAFYNI